MALKAEEQMELAKAGDSNAFENLVKEFYPAILNFFYKHIWDKDEAQDLTQKVFMRLYDSRERFCSQMNFSSYIYTIARNAQIDYFRKRKLSQEPENMELAGRDSVTEDVQFNELQLAVKSALQELTDEHREIFVLWHYQKLSYKQIAEAIDVPEGTVKSRVYYALQDLRRILKPYEQLT